MKSKRWRRILLMAGGLGLAALLVYGFLPKPVEVDLAEARRGPLQVTVEEDGKTRIKERYVVASPLAGQLLRVELKAGDPVNAGKTVLALIEPGDPNLLDDRARAQAEAKVKAAEAALKQAHVQRDRAKAIFELTQADLARGRHLLQSRSISQQEYDTLVQKEQTAAEELRAAEFGVQIAAFELEMARAALIRSRPRSPGEVDGFRFEIRSPITGRVLRVFQESSTPVTAGQRLLEVGEPRDLEVEVDVLSSDAVKIEPGAKVYLEHWGGRNVLLGRVRLVEPAAFTKVSALGVEEQRVWVIIDFTEPNEPRKMLGDAFRVEARIVVWEANNVLKVPAGALFRQGDAWAVFVVPAGSRRAILTQVEVGHSSGLETEIVSGLQEGDRVIVHPSDKIQNGVAVVPR